MDPHFDHEVRSLAGKGRNAAGEPKGLHGRTILHRVALSPSITVTDKRRAQLWGSDQMTEMRTIPMPRGGVRH